MSCNGDATTLHGCGGTWALSVFKSSGGNTAVPQPPASGSWTAAGCIKDGASRALTGYSFSSPSMTTELCTSTCATKGFSLAGTEFGTECYCECILFANDSSIFLTFQLRWQLSVERSRRAGHPAMQHAVRWQQERALRRKLGQQPVQAGQRLHDPLQARQALWPSAPPSRA